MPALVRYNGNGINVSSRSAASAVCTHTDFVVITGTRIAAEWVSTEVLRSNHVDIEDRIGDVIYICRFMPNNLSEIRQLDFIKTAHPLPVAAKISPDLIEYATSWRNLPEICIDVRFHRLAVDTIFNNAVAVANAAHVNVYNMEVRQGWPSNEDNGGVDGAAVRLWCREDRFVHVAGVDDVCFVGLPPPPKPSNGGNGGVNSPQSSSGASVVSSGYGGSGYGGSGYGGSMMGSSGVASP